MARHTLGSECQSVEKHMKQLTALFIVSIMFLQPASAGEQRCAAHALKQAEKLLEFHFGADDRISIDQTAQPVRPIKNPAGKGKYDVLQVWGYIYKGKYRVHFIYGYAGGKCILMGQEILEYANL